MAHEILPETLNRHNIIEAGNLFRAVVKYDAVLCSRIHDAVDKLVNDRWLCNGSTLRSQATRGKDIYTTTVDGCDCPAAMYWPDTICKHQIALRVVRIAMIRGGQSEAAWNATIATHRIAATADAEYWADRRRQYLTIPRRSNVVTVLDEVNAVEAATTADHVAWTATDEYREYTDALNKELYG